MKVLKRYSSFVGIFASLLFLLLMFTADVAEAQSSDEAYQIETFDISGEASLEVQTAGGSIDVIGSSGNEMKVEMYVKRRNRYYKQGDADLSRYDIEISKSGNTVYAKAKRESGSWGWDKDNYSISFVVYAPRDTRTRLKTSGGSVSANNLRGSQELRTSGGSIEAEGIEGNMVLKTSGGSITVKDARGWVDANTSGGRIVAESVIGDIEAKTSGGSITIEDVEGNIEARTSGGSITAEVRAPKEFIDLKTSGGSIYIKVPEGNGYDLDLDGGRIRADLANFQGSSERDELEGKINGGGTRLHAKTSGGSVNLEYF